jgi:hypothetical protein
VEHGLAGDPDTLLISVHEERRWPFTGALEDDGGGNVLNLPVPRGFNDSEMAAIRERLILPAVAAFAPEAIVLQCGADAVEEDPLSRLSLSNNAHWERAAGLMSLGCPRLLVLGGGGYNPWSVGRLWTGIWATLNGIEIPERLPKEGEEVLRALRWDRARADAEPARALVHHPARCAAPGSGATRDRATASPCCGDARGAGPYFRSFDSGLTFRLNHSGFCRSGSTGSSPCPSSRPPVQPGPDPPRPAQPVHDARA